MRIREGDPLEIYTDREGGVIFKKYSQLGDVSDFAGQLCDTISRLAGLPAVITDRDSCIAVGGVPRREVMDKRISGQVEQLMDERQAARVADRTVPLCEDGGSLPGSSVHGIFQARILESIAIFSSRGSF